LPGQARQGARQGLLARVLARARAEGLPPRGRPPGGGRPQAPGPSRDHDRRDGRRGRGGARRARSLRAREALHSRVMSIAHRAAFFVAVAALGFAACTSPDTEVLPSIACTSAPSDETTERASDVRVVVDAQLPEQVRADLRSYLERLWGQPIEVGTSAPSPTADAIVITRID